MQDAVQLWHLGIVDEFEYVVIDLVFNLDKENVVYVYIDKEGEIRENGYRSLFTSKSDGESMDG